MTVRNHKTWWENLFATDRTDSKKKRTSHPFFSQPLLLYNGFYFIEYYKLTFLWPLGKVCEPSHAVIQFDEGFQCRFPCKVSSIPLMSGDRFEG